MAINKKRLGDALQIIRHRLHLTQRQLAKKTGYTIEYISRLENGHSGASFEVMETIGEVFKIPAELLIMLASDGKDYGEIIERVRQKVWRIVDDLGR